MTSRLTTDPSCRKVRCTRNGPRCAGHAKHNHHRTGPPESRQAIAQVHPCCSAIDGQQSSCARDPPIIRWPRVDSVRFLQSQLAGAVRGFGGHGQTPVDTLATSRRSLQGVSACSPVSSEAHFYAGNQWFPGIHGLQEQTRTHTIEGDSPGELGSVNLYGEAQINEACRGKDLGAEDWARR
jgi:hypothetical protein